VNALSADKITEYLKTEPPDAPYSHQPEALLHGRDTSTDCNWSASNLLYWKHLIHTNQRPYYMAEILQPTATGLPVISCTGSQRLKPSSMSELSVILALCLEQFASVHSFRF